MNYPYIIIDDNQESVLKTKAVAESFSELHFLATATTYSEGLNLILEHHPKLVFLEIDPKDKKSNLSLALINELYRYLDVVPKIIITTTKKDFAFDAIQYGITDYLIKPVERIELIKTLHKIKKSKPDNPISTIPNSIADSNQTKSATTDSISAAVQKGTNSESSLIICIKSYGDYRYIDARDICYFQADNNSTDIHLNTGEMVTAFKTLKHFEGVLTNPFSRIHNSYIVNRNYISRIHTGNAVCYIKNTTIKIPFSKSYKENIDLIIAELADGNYLEI